MRRIHPAFNWFLPAVLILALPVPVARGEVPGSNARLAPSAMLSVERLPAAESWHPGQTYDTVSGLSASFVSRLPTGSSLSPIGAQPVSHVPGPTSPWWAQQHQNCVAGGTDEFPQIDEACDVGCAACADELQWLPEGLRYKAYIAGEKEPRFSSAWFEDDVFGTIWEAGLGGRLGILRRGSCGSIRPEGWQIDMQGGVLPRLQANEQDLIAVDYRFGLVNTWRQGPIGIKLAYDHLSSHLGDEFLLANPGVVRRNFARDAVVLGAAFDTHPSIRVYGEIGVALSYAGGSEPVEFQYGVEYSPTCPGGAPFLAVNAHLRQEFDFAGSFNILGGWQCRSEHSDRVFRVGGQYYNGKSLQHSFFDKNEELTGFGMWMDF